jgi:hypothetical protein
MSETTARLLAHYAAAGNERVSRGRRWYPRMREILAGIARDTGYALEQVAAVLAITSPGAQVITNLEWTLRACETDGREKVGRFPNVVAPKIAAALSGNGSVSDHVIGPKIAPFFHAILGDADALVLDRWAIYAAMPHLGRETVPNKRVRAELESAYREAAASVGETVAAFQAIVWIQVRETTANRKTGKPHRLVDIV